MDHLETLPKESWRGKWVLFLAHHEKSVRRCCGLTVLALFYIGLMLSNEPGQPEFDSSPSWSHLFAVWFLDVACFTTGMMGGSIVSLSLVVIIAPADFLTVSSYGKRWLRRVGVRKVATARAVAVVVLSLLLFAPALISLMAI